MFGIGAVFGYVDFQLEERRGHSAIAASDANVTVFTRADLDRYTYNCHTVCATGRLYCRYYVSSAIVYQC